MTEQEGPTGHEPQLGVGSWFWVNGIPFQITELKQCYDRPAELVAKTPLELMAKKAISEGSQE